MIRSVVCALLARRYPSAEELTQRRLTGTNAAFTDKSILHLKRSAKFQSLRGAVHRSQSV